MIDEEKVQKAAEIFCESPTFRKYYETVPADASRRYVELAFALSCRHIKLGNKERLEIAQEMKGLRSQFTLEDLKFDCAWCMDNEYKTEDEERIKELEAKQNSD